MPPTVLLSQLVEGDEESFDLALACHARRRGRAIRVESPYLPQYLLRAAEPF